MATAVAGVGLASNVLGGITGAVGSIFGGQSNAAMYNYQAAIARYNAQVAMQTANYDINVGEVEAQKEGMKTRFQIGQTRATQGASGLDINTGTNVKVRSSEAEVGAEDQALIRNKAAWAAYGAETQATSDIMQSQLDTMAASNSQTAGYLGAATSVLGAGGNFASNYIKASQAGLV